MQQEMVVLKIKTSTIIKVTIVTMFTVAGVRTVTETILPHAYNLEKKLKQDIVETIVDAVVPDENADNAR
jgi:hypothetical protein